MTNEIGALAPVHGRFRPESISHFKEAAKNMAWLLDRPNQKCQEDLARIYGYSGLHELQQVLKQPGVAGPFAPRYNYLSSDDEGLVEEHDRRIFFVLFGVPKGRWREERVATEDKNFLVFEIGLFQEAAEHRACFEKVRQVVDWDVARDRWPLIHGWPVGLKSRLGSGYTEPLDLAEGWRNRLPQAQYCPTQCADIRWQSRMTGLVRLATMFQILAPRVGAPKPSGMGRVAFGRFEPEGGGINDPSFEAYYLTKWLTKKSLKGSGPAKQRQELIRAFVERPSRATAAACEFVKDLEDPVAFRDRWAFECVKAALDRYTSGSKALFSSSLAGDNTIQSLFLHMDADSAEISDSWGCQVWRFHYTRSEVTEPVNAGSRPTLQPVIHANGALIVPYDDNLIYMSPSDWFFSHDLSEFAREEASLSARNRR